MGRSNGNIIPIHRRMKHDDKRPLMDWEQAEYDYDMTHGYNLKDWGKSTDYTATVPDDQIWTFDEGSFVSRPMTDEEKRAMIPQAKPWWRRLMAWMGGLL